MTEARANKIIAVIESYNDKDALYSMTPEDAAKALGNDITADEMVELYNCLATASKVANSEGEIPSDALESVAGGSGEFWLGVAAGAGAGLCGVIATGVIMCCW